MTPAPRPDGGDPRADGAPSPWSASVSSATPHDPDRRRYNRHPRAVCRVLWRPRLHGGHRRRRHSGHSGRSRPSARRDRDGHGHAAHRWHHCYSADQGGRPYATESRDSSHRVHGHGRRARRAGCGRGPVRHQAVPSRPSGTSREPTATTSRGTTPRKRVTMSALAEQIAHAVHQNAPHPYCFTCLAAQQAVNEHDIRAVALVLVARAGLRLAHRVCFRCQWSGEVLVAPKAASTRRWRQARPDHPSGGSQATVPISAGTDSSRSSRSADAAVSLCRRPPGM